MATSHLHPLPRRPQHPRYHPTPHSHYTTHMVHLHHLDPHLDPQINLHLNPHLNPHLDLQIATPTLHTVLLLQTNPRNHLDPFEVIFI